MKIIAAGILMLCTACGWNSTAFMVSPKAVDGVMDLGSWDFDANGPVRLDGRWEFYWQQLLRPEDFRGTAVPVMTGYIKVPSIWNKTVINGKALSGQGFGTYRLKIRTRDKRGSFGIKLKTISSAYRLYIDGHLVSSAGLAGPTRNTTMGTHMPRAVYFPVPDTIEIICQVSNFEHNKGGLWYSSLFGPDRQIQTVREKMVGLEMFLIGVFLAIGLYHFVLYVLRRKNNYTFFFGLFCLIIALRTSLMGENLWMAVFPGFSWEWKVKLEMLTFYLSTPVFLEFITRFYPEMYSAAVNRVFHGIGLLFSAVLVLTPYAFSYPLMNPYVFITLTAILYILSVMYRSYATRKTETIVFLTGFSFTFYTLIHDFLSINQVIYTGTIFPFGLGAFIISQAVMISIQSARAFQTAENLGTILEGRVIERTNELEVERNKLKQRNEIIENDLEMARNIQMKLIPAAIDYPGISFHYKPMDKIGGDFYDFITFSNPEKIGIFISDVSGHGVPAAFITSMIKTVILQAGSLRENPAGLLSKLNDILLTQTGGNFITAFYAILDTKTRELTFANAGHNPPYLIYRDRVEALGQKSRAIPLAIRDNDKLRKVAREYMNESIQLNGCNKLFLYTDGLTEAKNIDEYMAAKKRERESGIINYIMDDFESAGLSAALMESRDLPSAGFIKNLYESLLRFRGCDYFDDDICMICIDV